ncbi:hypothetical protein C8035_v011287 [Colletotrichum spinosum]|uniref:RNase H type-1 domain-containing protein n=1 Tax=Colletotrichum spinosum TaxID=1347390 RepID=A0A4R8PY90_9PEZI|nr:hypothetical protein C8035_v011287 [Colletotrichum spinosum]
MATRLVMDSIHENYVRQVAGFQTQHHYQIDAWQKSGDILGANSTHQSQTFTDCSPGKSRLIAAPRAAAKPGKDAAPWTSRFQGDLIILPKTEAIYLPKASSAMAPTATELNLFSDGSFSGPAIQQQGASTPDQPAGVAIAYKHFGAQAGCFNSRTFQLLGCPDFRVAELWGLTLALETADLFSHNLLPGMKSVNIFSDCKDAIRLLMRSEANYQDPLIKRAVKASRSLDAKNIRVRVHWCPGHAGIRGNEMADLAAKKVRRCEPGDKVPVVAPEGLSEWEISSTYLHTCDSRERGEPRVDPSTINPETGRPWNAPQFFDYTSNYQPYDYQLAMAQAQGSTQASYTLAAQAYQYYGASYQLNPGYAVHPGCLYIPPGSSYPLYG